MGSYLNYAHIDPRGRLQLRGHHKLGGFGHYHLFRGPEGAFEYLHEVLKSHDEVVYPDAESHLLIDERRKNILVKDFELRDSSHTRRGVLLELARLYWPGWRISIAPRGVVSMVEYLREHVPEFNEDGDSYFARKLTPATREQVRAGAALGAEHGMDAIASVILDGGEVRHHYLIRCLVPHILGLGDEILDILAAAPVIRPPPERERVFDGGFIAHVGEKRLQYWLTGDFHPHQHARIVDNWPGWSVEGREEAYPAQLIRAGITEPEAKPADYLDEIKSEILKWALHKPDHPRFLEIFERYRASLST